MINYSVPSRWFILTICRFVEHIENRWNFHLRNGTATRLILQYRINNVKKQWLTYKKNFNARNIFRIITITGINNLVIIDEKKIDWQKRFGNFIISVLYIQHRGKITISAVQNETHSFFSFFFNEEGAQSDERLVSVASVSSRRFDAKDGLTLSRLFNYFNYFLTKCRRRLWM